MEHSHVISGQAFGSSKKLQFIGMSSMDSLLTAIDNAHRIHLPKPVKRDTMSIESILDNNGHHYQQYTTYPTSNFCDETSSKRRYLDRDDHRSIKIRRGVREKTVVTPPPLPAASPPSPIMTSPHQRQRMMTITCLHAAVAQKSYGSEKRFLCPPPVVSVRSADQRAESLVVAVSIVSEGGERPPEQRTVLNDKMHGSFKYLHVTGTAKAKQFCLRVSLSHQSQNPASSTPPPSATQTSASTLSTQLPYATFFSTPVSIISKPSKKTAKARNVSSCILANSHVSLFNRINSQTVRTKYMTSEDNRLCAKNASWSPFDIIVIRQPNGNNNNSSNPSLALPGRPSSSSAPVMYGSEIILRDTQTSVTSPPMIVRKVDKGNTVPHAFGPVSQMQKIALQLASDKTMFLSAASKTTTHGGNTTIENNPANAWLDFTPSRQTKTAEGQPQEEVDDYHCWTIVGIAKFEYTFFEPEESIRPEPQQQLARYSQPSPPPSPPRSIVPFPVLSAVRYNVSHTIDITGQNLMQMLPTPRLLEFWIGTHGPLTTHVLQEQSQTHLSLELPSKKDLLSQAELGTTYLELPLLLVRHDGVVYHSGKALACDFDTGRIDRWSIVTVGTPSST
ncbi:hypothetical protein DFQ28_005729 [Apophysomyces sp. BC1034]|nr:hypothetical protein DFQ30_003786 [Apophysomyces sp. BC1015]KAG0182618.1 hypothetical protein DFQ29_003171 [Apophysomyces sp. BC1021]KAG0193286.1 hypothetical protein DFQ28_005729 [Apophysomyces sp. BC1034]